MDGIWHLNAPQWTDFESSPQIPDDNYFDREHEGLEPQPFVNEVIPAIVIDETSENDESELKMKHLEVPGPNDALINEIEIAKMTPVKVVVSPRSRIKTNLKTKETTYDNVLSEAMASLQLSIKKKARRSQSARNTQSNIMATPTNAERTAVAKTLNLNKGPRSTPSNPIPMWIRKTKPSENSVDNKPKNAILQENLEPQDLQKNDNSSALIKAPKIGENLLNKEVEEPVEDETHLDDNDLAAQEQPQDLQDANEFKEDDEAPVPIDDIAPLIEPPVPGPSKRGSNNSQRSSCSNKGQSARFSTCQLRRRSLTQYRRRSNKYVSLAEAISSFQNKTPVRFRSVSLKNAKPGPVQKIRQSSVTATVPISPALRCKSRTRPAPLSQEERERREIEEMRKRSVRENLARTSSLKTLAHNFGSKITGKQPATNVEQPSQPIELKNLNAAVVRETRVRVTVPSVICTDEGIAIQDAEISNFGVPDITTSKLTTTKTMPFSFETRNKELQKKKEKKIKELMTEEEKKTKVAFHARPVPTFKKPMLTASKETGAAKPRIKPCPFSFEERDKKLIKKKENFIKTVIEEDKKARIFQAKPIPEFKPVLVRGVSKENINSGHKSSNVPPPSHNQKKTRISMLPVAKTGSRNCLLGKANVSNQENQNPLYPKLERCKSNEPHQKTVLTEFHLNTDKRAKDRKEFDERIKQKEQEIEILRKKAELEKLKRDETERAEIRKMAEIKARPMPAYKPPAHIQSNKPLTEPQSPGWSTKPKR